MLIIRLRMTELLLSDNKMISKYIYRFIIVKNKNSYTNKVCKINTGNNPPIILWSFRYFCGLSGNSGLSGKSRDPQSLIFSIQGL